MRGGDHLGELSEVAARVAEPLNVPGAEEERGGRAGLEVDGLGEGSSTIEQNQQRTRKKLPFLQFRYVLPEPLLCATTDSRSGKFLAHTPEILSGHSQKIPRGLKRL